MRTRLEANATNLIMEAVRSGRHDMMVSPVHDAEVEALDEIVR